MAIPTPLAYYKFDSSNSNDSVGTKHGTDTSVSYQTGKIGNGAGFNASTDKIALGSFELTAAFSVSGWVKLSSLSGVQTFMSTSSGTTGTDVFSLIVSVGGGQVGYSNFVNDSGWGGSTIATGSWYHVVWTHDGTTVRCYLNGVLNDTDNITHVTATKATFIGQRGDDQQGISGEVDEIGIWNSQLSADDVAKLYNAGRGNQYAFTEDLTTSCEAYYKFSSNSNDETGSNNGTDTSITYGASYGKIGDGANFTAASNSRSAIGNVAGTGRTLGTISVWLKSADEGSANIDRSILGHNGWSATGHFVFELYTRSGYSVSDRPFLYVYGMDPEPTNSANYNSQIDVGNNTFRHVVVTWNSTANTVKYYVDGVFDVTRTFTTVPAINLSDAFIGSWFVGGAYRSYNNALDELGIWTRELTSTEVSNLYASGSPGSSQQYPFTAVSTFIPQIMMS